MLAGMEEASRSICFFVILSQVGHNFPGPHLKRTSESDHERHKANIAKTRLFPRDSRDTLGCWNSQPPVGSGPPAIRGEFLSQFSLRDLASEASGIILAPPFAA